MRACSIALAAAALAAACDTSSPTSPLQNIRRGNTEVVISGIQIVGPQTLAPGESAQFRMVAAMSDGTSRDFTNDAAWSNVGDAQVISVSEKGLVTARGTGDGSIAASIEGRRPTAEVIVVPPGTYRITGTVMEPGHSAISEALVEIIPRDGPRQSARTDVNGAYKVHGVSGDIEVRVTKQGYREYSQRYEVAFHQNISVELVFQ